MAESVKISVIIHMEGANRDFYRSFLESLAQNTYKNFELVITDSGHGESNENIAKEFFPEAGVLTYRKVRGNRTRGYALNYAASLAKGDLFLFFDRHSRLGPTALYELSKVAEDADIIYADNNEIEGTNRINPDYKPDANPELIRHRNYIGDIFAISRKTVGQIGLFKDALNYAYAYELLLRAFEKRLRIVHIPKLLYSKRVLSGLDEKRLDPKLFASAYKEHLAAAGAHLKRMGIDATVKGLKYTTHWKVSYNGTDYKNHRHDYLVVRAKNVRVRLKDAIPKMYGILKQPDVGIVGCAMTFSPFSFDNCGFIFDGNGQMYPACHGQSVLYDGYNLRCILPTDVSAVDYDFCLIKRKVYKGLNGFDKSIPERGMMLDFCLRAKKAGYRTVFTPAVKARKKSPFTEIDSTGGEVLLEKWRDVIENGDPFYNRHLPMGIDNYFLY